jgi:hypothetical protein
MKEKEDEHQQATRAVQIGIGDKTQGCNQKDETPEKTQEQGKNSNANTGTEKKGKKEVKAWNCWNCRNQEKKGG